MTIPQQSSQGPSAQAVPLPRVLTDRTAFLLQVAAQRAQAMGEEALADSGVSGREYGVLALLEGGSRPSQRQIGAALGIDRTTTTAILKDLEDRGLVARVPDARDRRANAVTLTRAGERLSTSAARVLMECEERYLEGLDAIARDTLRTILTRLISP